MVQQKKGKSYHSNHPQKDLEAELATEITKTGRFQIKKRLKAGLSVFYLKNGRIIELRSDKTEIAGKPVAAKWITLEKSKRKLTLK